MTGFSVVHQLEIRRRRSLMSAQGSSSARTLGQNLELRPTLKGFGGWRTLSGFNSI